MKRVLFRMAAILLLLACTMILALAVQAQNAVQYQAVQHADAAVTSETAIQTSPTVIIQTGTTAATDADQAVAADISRPGFIASSTSSKATARSGDTSASSYLKNKFVAAAF